MRLCNGVPRRSDALPKIKDERILAHLSADQILDLITPVADAAVQFLFEVVNLIRWREIDRRV